MSVVVLIAESANARFLKALRVLRATRPLRVLTRSQSMLMVGAGACRCAEGGAWRQACRTNGVHASTRGFWCRPPSNAPHLQVFHTLIRSLAEMANVTGTMHGERQPNHGVQWRTT